MTTPRDPKKMMHQCTAHAKGTGLRCKNNAITGSNVCRNHGGSAPQVKRKAAERLKEARDLALQKFVDYLTAGTVDAKTTLDASVKLTELTETLEGRVARREEQLQNPYANLSDDELERAIVREAESITRGTQEA